MNPSSVTVPGRAGRSVLPVGHPRTAAAVLAVALMLGAGAAAAMGARTPAPPPVQVDRAAPARPMSDPPNTAPALTPGSGGPAQTIDILSAAEVTPDSLLFRRRAVVVFADTPADPAFVQQMQALDSQAAPLAARNVVVISDSDPAQDSVWRRTFNPHGFSLVLIDEDGQIKQRKPQPWDVREIARAIDKFPSRIEELRIGRQPPAP